MTEDASFRDLVRRVRARDEQAAAELVRRYEPALRVAIRARLTDARLRRLLDSVDICQSVLANFFVRAASGQFELERSEQLLKLLVTMARNHLINRAVEQRAARRDQRRLQPGDPDEMGLAASGPSPSEAVANQELLQAFRARLTEEERRIADARAAGRGWGEIAAEAGETADALQVRFARAVNQAARAVGLEG